MVLGTRYDAGVWRAYFINDYKWFINENATIVNLRFSLNIGILSMRDTIGTLNTLICMVLMLALIQSLWDFDLFEEPTKGGPFCKTSNEFQRTMFSNWPCHSTSWRLRQNFFRELILLERPGKSFSWLWQFTLFFSRNMKNNAFESYLWELFAFPEDAHAKTQRRLSSSEVGR